jgi:hypothetical protein
MAVKATFRRLTPRKETRYPLYRRLGGAPGPVWTGAENLAPTGIRSPDRPARNQSLYRLRYCGQRTVQEIFIFLHTGQTGCGPNRHIMQGAPAALPVWGKSAGTSLRLRGSTPSLLRSPLRLDIWWCIGSLAFYLY